MGRTGVVPSVLSVPGAAPLLLACTLFAVYCCVPETSHLPWVALAVASLAAMEFGGHRLMPWWSGAVALLVAWSGWQGGQYRSSALVGAAFAWWPWVLVWGVHALARAAGGRASVRAGAVSAAAGVVAAVAVARSGALARTMPPALVAVAVAVVASVPVVAGALAAEHALWHRRHPGSHEAVRAQGVQRGDDATRRAGRVGAEWRDAGVIGSAADDAGGGGGRDQQPPVDVD